MADVEELTGYVMQWAHRGGKRSDDCFPIYVRLLRQRKGLTRSALSAQTGITGATLVAIENDLIPMVQLEAAQLQSLETCFGMSYQDFLKMQSHIASSLDDEQADVTHSLHA